MSVFKLYLKNYLLKIIKRTLNITINMICVYILKVNIILLEKLHPLDFKVL